MTVLTKGTNGVSYGYIHTVTAEDEFDMEVIIDFQTSFYLVASVNLYTPTGEYLDMFDIEVDYPALGQVRIKNGKLSSLAEGQRLDVLAQYARGDV